MHASSFLLSAFTLTGLCAAQTYTAHPIDNHLSSTSQNIPFAGNSTSWDEARSQFLWLAAFLPGTPSVITGVDLVPTLTYATPYESFEIYLDHTTNTALSTTFANNLTNPVLVYSVTNGTVPWVGGNWQTLNFTTPFAYDGVRNVVMEVRKKINRPLNPPTTAVTHRVLVYPRRADLPVPIWAFGAYGSGASTAASTTTVYNTQVLMRLRWTGPRTLTINSTRDTTGNANRSYFHIGATLTITTQGLPGEFYLAAIDLSGLAVAPIVIPGINGAIWMTAPLIFNSGFLDGAGLGSLPVFIPSNPGLVGIRAIFQSGILGTPSHITNAVDAPIAVF